MPITLINHSNSPGWTEKNKKLRNKNNGARIYSKAITKYYYPVFHEMFQESFERVALVTVTLESRAQCFKDFKKVFIFLHECNWQKQPVIARAKNIVRANPHARIIFIVWHEETAHWLEFNGMEAIFVPMAIDLKEIEEAKSNRIKKYDDRLIWFGHIRRTKKPYFDYFCEEAKKCGYKVDWISANTLNGEQALTRKDVLKTLQKYKYGIGVGQCAQEMAALGLRVILYAYNYKCNCAYTKEKADYYTRRNLVSQEETNVLVRDALRRLDDLVLFTPVDIRQQAKELPKLLSKYKINSK